MKVLVLAFALIGCNKFKGNLDIQDHLIFKNKKGNNQVLVIGEYDALVKINKNKKITIKAKNLFEDVKIELKLPKEIGNYFTNDSNSEETTRFNLPKNITGQPFSVKGVIDTETIEGEEVTETQVCSNSPRWDIDCQWYGGPTLPGRYYGPNTWCYGVPTGTREVTYRMDTTISSVSLEIANDETPNAFLNAKSMKDKKVVLETSRCEY